ncbi:unnamed protein product [Protopolystoma xenopodis]|uniref:Uncharacterized protein n=1 Tax=Protopolystoma xenopodis TaxID=117903 RepID=A0A3S5AZC0_9PLAT|nr:unnamed protein product [Protopolystoma xenopodis]
MNASEEWVSDEARAANEVRLIMILDEAGWATDQFGLITNFFLCLMQAELDCFQNRARFLTDYYR